MPLRECLIPKNSESVDAPVAMRRLAIPAVADRVLQTAVALLLTPVLEREFADNSFAWRKGLGVQKAVARVEQLRDQGFVWVVDADIEAFFDSIAHDALLRRLQPFVQDDRVMALIEQWLTAPLHTVDAQLLPRHQGVPQGSPLSPLLSNLYLDTLDDALIDADHHLVRFADDFLILCRHPQAAQDALNVSREVLQSLELRLNSDKTRIVNFNDGFRFLGVNFVRTLAVPGGPKKGTRAAVQTAPVQPPGDMPDETTAMAEAEEDAPAPVRQKTTPVLRTLYLLEQGAQVQREGDSLLVTHDGEALARLGLPQLDLVLVFGNVGISTPALQACMYQRVPVVYMTKTGRLYGVARADDICPANLVRAQVRASDDAAVCLDMARALVRAKLINSRVLLARLARHRRATATQVADWHSAGLALRDASWRCKTAPSLETLRGLEGASAARYFAALRAMLPVQWEFGPRVAWPAPDPINAMLSFGYSLLRANVLAMINAEGLNPQIAFLHADGHGHAALASDLMEPFRALVVDAMVFDLVSHRRLAPEDFSVQTTEEDVTVQTVCRMGADASRLMVHEFEERMQASIRVQGPHGQREPVSWRHLLLQTVKDLAHALRHQRTFTPWVGK